MDKIKILIADDMLETRKSVKQILELTDKFEVIGEACDGEEAIKKAGNLKPDVILMDINMPKRNGLEATEEITLKYPEIVVIIMSVQNETDYLKKAMLNGAKEYIIKPFDTEQIIHTIESVYFKQKEIKKEFKRYNNIEKNGKITSYFSPKGGVGNTLLSAIDSFIKKEDRKTIIVDLDLYFGDLEIIMNISSLKTIEKAIEENAHNEINKLNEFIIHKEENLDLLLAPKDPAEAENISAQDLEQILKCLKKQYDEIILDLGTNYSDITLAAIEKSDFINIVMTPDLMALKNTKVALDIFKSLNIEFDKLRIFVNRYDKENSLSTKRIKKVLAKDIFLLIPEDIKNISKAIQLGKPLVTSFGFTKNKILKAFRKIR